MPLPEPVRREPLHTRRVECRGYRRADGWWDIEGHLVDTKDYPFANEFRGEIAPGIALHDMWLRLTVDDALVVRDVVAVTEAGPYAVCPAITPAFTKLVGLTIGPGWRREVLARLGGIRGCTHLVELLWPLATAAYQTIYPVLARERPARDEDRPPAISTAAMRSRAMARSCGRTTHVGTRARADDHAAAAASAGVSALIDKAWIRSTSRSAAAACTSRWRSMRLLPSNSALATTIRKWVSPPSRQPAWPWWRADSSSISNGSAAGRAQGWRGAARRPMSCWFLAGSGWASGRHVRPGRRLR